MLYNSPRELLPRTDNAAPDEAQKGLLRTSPVETGLIREGSWPAVQALSVRMELPQWLVA